VCLGTLLIFRNSWSLEGYCTCIIAQRGAPTSCLFYVPFFEFHVFFGMVNLCVHVFFGKINVFVYGMHRHSPDAPRDPVELMSFTQNKETHTVSPTHIR